MRQDRADRGGRGSCTLAALAVLALSVSAAGLAVGVAAVPSAAAGADPLAGCTTTTGVVVVVDLTSWAQGVQRGCAGTVAPGTTGYQALTEAGFVPVGDDQDGPAFVCRIDGYPTAAQDPCVTTPPATAYWSYWYAPAGQDSWSYSQFGAMSFHPSPGSVNAWSFGAGKPPAFAPSTVWATTVGPPGGGSTTTTAPAAAGGSAPTATTTTTAGTHAPTTGPPPAPRTGAGAVPSAISGQVSRAPGGGPGVDGGSSTPPTTTTRPTPSGASAVSGASAAASPTGGAPRIVDAAPVSAEGTSSKGSPVPLIVGVAVAAGLVGWGGLVVRRRRRAGGP